MAVVKSARLLLYNSMDSGSFLDSAVAEDADNALQKEQGEEAQAEHAQGIRTREREVRHVNVCGDVNLQVPIDVGLTMHFHGRAEHLNWQCRTAGLC